MNELFTVHDSVSDKTSLLGRQALLEFLFRVLPEGESAHDLLFAVESYGPRRVMQRYLITKHSLDGLR